MLFERGREKIASDIQFLACFSVLSAYFPQFTEYLS